MEEENTVDAEWNAIHPQKPKEKKIFVLTCLNMDVLNEKIPVQVHKQEIITLWVQSKKCSDGCWEWNGGYQSLASKEKDVPTSQSMDTNYN